MLSGVDLEDVALSLVPQIVTAVRGQVLAHYPIFHSHGLPVCEEVRVMVNAPLLDVAKMVTSSGESSLLPTVGTVEHFLAWTPQLMDCCL